MTKLKKCEDDLDKVKGGIDGGGHYRSEVEAEADYKVVYEAALKTCFSKEQRGIAKKVREARQFLVEQRNTVNIVCTDLALQFDRVTGLKE